MNKKKTVRGRLKKTPASIFEEALGKFQYQKGKLTKVSLEEAEKAGEGLFKLETVWESFFPDGWAEVDTKGAKEAVMGFLDKVKGLYKDTYTEDELKVLVATGAITNPRKYMAIGDIGISKTWKSTEESYTLAYGFKISLLQHELEDALAKDDIYRACFCCIQIGGLWHLLKMLPLNEPVRQMTGRNKELRWKKRKIPESEVDARKIIDFYNDGKKTFEKENKTSHGSSKHALNSACEKFKLGPTSIKKILRTYTQKTPAAGTRLFKIAYR